MVTKRKEIEAQYFQGKIDEPTFRKMLVGEQNKILSARAKAIEKANERQRLIKNRLSPKSVLVWLASGPVLLIRKIIKSSRRIKGKNKTRANPDNEQK